MKRQRAAFGSITEVAKGKQYRLRFWADLTDGRGYTRHSRMVYGTYREARTELASLEVTFGRTRGKRTKIPTMQELYESYVKPRTDARYAAGKMSYSTYRLRDLLWRNCAPFHSKLVTNVRPIEVQELLSKLKPQTAQRTRQMMREVLAVAVMMELIPANPMDARYIMPTKTQETKSKVYTLEELNAFAAKLENTPYLVPFVLMAFGSCRVGESLGAGSQDVEVIDTPYMQVAAVHITKQVDQLGNVSHTLKNPQSVRWVIIPSPYSNCIIKAANTGSEWLADNGCGRPIAQPAFRSKMRDILGERIEVRALRRSWETIAKWTLGIPAEQIEKLMGHKGTTITAMHYDRPNMEQLAKVVAKAWSDYYQNLSE